MIQRNIFLQICLTVLFGMFSFTGLHAMSSEPVKPAPVIAIEDFTNLVWSDEFNGKEIDLSNWSYETTATGWKKEWNNERQDYKDAGKGSENAFVTNGFLVIRAIRIDSGKYSSVRMITKGKHSWKYGHIAARMKLPYGNGIWPAFWMLGDNYDKAGWPECGEIDIMELIGGNNGKNRGGGDNVSHGTLHGPGYSGAAGIHRKYTLAQGDFKDDFHTFEIAWNESGISWYVDGTNFNNVGKRSGWVFDNNFYILLNLAIGGNWGGYPDGSTIFPQDMTVDWVRVYQ